MQSLVMMNCQKIKALPFRKGVLTYSRRYLKMTVSISQREYDEEETCDFQAARQTEMLLPRGELLLSEKTHRRSDLFASSNAIHTEIYYVFYILADN